MDDIGPTREPKPSGFVVGSRVVFVRRVGAGQVLFGGAGMNNIVGSRAFHVALPLSVGDGDESAMSCGEVRFAAVRVRRGALHLDSPGTRSGFTPHCSPGSASRILAGIDAVPLRCSTSIAKHPCGCFAAVSLQAELRAAFLRAVFALVAVKLVQKGDEPLGTTDKRVCGRWDAR